jgi:RNA polymerase sigma-70 factor (ECF subfamily)
MSSGRRDVFEREMRARYSEGKTNAVVEGVLREYGPEVLGFLVALLRDHDAASDVYADFCASLCAGLPTFRWESSLRTWCYAIARNGAARFRRDPLRRRGVDLGEHPEVMDIPSRTRTVTSTYRRTEVKERLSAFRQSLNPDDQMLLVLRVDRALAWDDIAQIMSDPFAPKTGDEAEARRRSAATLRKRFERIKAEIRTLVASRELSLS